MTPPSRTLRFASVAALAIAVAFATSDALAAPPEAPSATAEQLAEQAYQLHAAGKDAEAIATYLRAYELSQAGAILYNVATIYDRKLAERGLAEDYYRRYLVAPDAEPDLVRKATERLTALKKEDEDEAAAKRTSIVVAPVPTPLAPGSAAPPQPVLTPPLTRAPIPDATEPAPSSGQALRTTSIVVGAVGVAGVGASLILGMLAKGKNDDANAVCNGAVCSNQNGVALANQAGTLATASTACFVAGLALVGGGVTMYLIAPKDAPAAPSVRITLSPRIAPSMLGLGVGGAF